MITDDNQKRTKALEAVNEAAANVEITLKRRNAAKSELDTAQSEYEKAADEYDKARKRLLQNLPDVPVQATPAST